MSLSGAHLVDREAHQLWTCSAGKVNFSDKGRVQHTWLLEALLSMIQGVVTHVTHMPKKL